MRILYYIVIILPVIMVHTAALVIVSQFLTESLIHLNVSPQKWTGYTVAMLGLLSLTWTSFKITLKAYLAFLKNLGFLPKEVTERKYVL